MVIDSQFNTPRQEHVFDKIDLVNNQAAQGKIKSSKSGFLKSAIEDNYHNQHAVDRKRQIEAEKIQIAAKKKEDTLESLKAAQKLLVLKNDRPGM